MDTNLKTPAFFEPQTVEGEAAMAALKCAVNLMVSAKNMYCDGDNTNCEPVTLLICAETVATQPLEDVDQLYGRLFEVKAMLKAVESTSVGPVHPRRRGLLACALTLCEAGHKVADGGFGGGDDQVAPDEMLNLLMPFMPDQVEGLGERISAERACRQLSGVQHG